MQNNKATEPQSKLDAPKWATLIHTSNFVQGFRAPRIIWLKIIANEKIDKIKTVDENLFFKKIYRKNSPIIPAKEDAILWVMCTHPKKDSGMIEDDVQNGQDEHTVPAPFQTAYEPVSNDTKTVKATIPAINEYLSKINWFLIERFCVLILT